MCCTRDTFTQQKMNTPSTPTSPPRSRMCVPFCTGNSAIFLAMFTCALVQIVYEMDQTIIAANAKPLSDYFKVSVTSIGTLFFARACIQVIVQPFWGIASDKYDRKWLLFIGTAIWGVVTIAFGMSSKWGIALVLRYSEIFFFFLLSFFSQYVIDYCTIFFFI